MVITGFAPPKVTLYANLGGREYRLVTKDDGSFTFDLDTPLKANTRFWFMYLIEEVNPHAPSYMSDYVHEMVLRDTVAPKPPSIIKINKIYNYSTRTTGKTEAYATVIVKKGSTVIAKGKAQKNGDFSLKVNKQKSGTLLAIKVSDSAKNTSKAKKITVYKGR